MADQQVQGMLVQIEATTAQLRRELAAADQVVARSTQAIDRNLATVDSAFDRAGAAAQGAGVLMRGAFAAVAGAGLIGGIIKQVDAYGQMSDRMKAAAGSAAEYQLVQEHLLQTAQETYRPMAEAQELYIRTADVMRSLGFNTQQTLDITDSFSFLLVTNAAAADKAGSALDAYSKALQTGKVEADGWVAIQGAMPTIVDAIANATGKSADEVRKLGVEGKLSLEAINTGLLRTVDVNRKAAADMSTSVQDALVNISNAIQTFLGGMEEQTGAVAGL
ncbi:MAG: phage tail tape measure protein, partial [Pseudomonas sp.]